MVTRLISTKYIINSKNYEQKTLPKVLQIRNKIITCTLSYTANQTHLIAPTIYIYINTYKYIYGFSRQIAKIATYFP